MKQPNRRTVVLGDVYCSRPDWSRVTLLIRKAWYARTTGNTTRLHLLPRMTSFLISRYVTKRLNVPIPVSTSAISSSYSVHRVPSTVLGALQQGDRGGDWGYVPTLQFWGTPIVFFYM